VSSILDALRELEASRAPGRPAPQDAPRPSARVGLFVAALAASAVGAVVAGLLVRSALLRRVPAEAVTVEAPAPVPAPEAAAPPPPVAVPDATPGLAQAELPRAQVAPRAAGALASATPFAAVRPARRSAALDAAESAPAIEQAVRPGEPRVRIMDLHYTENPAARRVTIGIGGGTPVTLGEGDTVEGLEVSLILPDRAYFRHAGNIFAARPGR
jgi:hypothetical protein